MGTYDEQISQALNRALASLQAHLEADLGSLTQALVAAADDKARQAATDAADAAAAAARRHADTQISQLKDDAKAQLADVRSSMQGQMDEAVRAAQARADDARRAAAVEASTLQKKIVALEAELDLARHEARVNLERAQSEIERLRNNTQSLAEEALIAQLADVEAAADRRTAAEIDRVRTDAHQADLADAVSVLNGIRAIDDARSLGDVLNALAQSAGREVERAGVLIVKGDGLRGWRFSGFTPEMLQQPGGIVVARDSAGLIGSVAAKGVSDTVSPLLTSDEKAIPAFARGAGARHAVAMPIAVGGQVVAVLYADAIRSDVLSAVSRWPAVLEVLVRHASRSLEALTVQQATGLAPPMPTVSVARKPLPGPLEFGGTGDDAAARRYARLLVSEIRMYHEPAVDAARRTRDLRARLGGEIDRARRLYEERIPAAVRQTADYFEQELVRTLADGDRTLLG